MIVAGIVLAVGVVFVGMLGYALSRTAGRADAALRQREGDR